MARRVAKPQRVSELLGRYLKKAGLSERLAQAGIVEAWPKLVGDRIASNAQAMQVRPAPWAQELSLMTPQVIARLNAGRTEGRISGIHWTVGRD